MFKDNLLTTLSFNPLIKMMKKFIQTVLCSFLLTISAYAQTRSIKGTVIDKDDGQPMAGVSVSVKGTGLGTQTDRAGNFSISGPSGNATIVFSFIGYIKKEVNVAANTEKISVVLQNDTKSLSEVIVVGALGLQKQTRESGYSQATIKSADLTQAHPTNLQNGLVGKVSGLNISTVNNGVNADTRITLRGIRSLTGNNQVLLVVDGVPVTLDYINSINPNDVESVNILKGANASALYGPDGVNGVLLVTTKRGIPNKPAEITLSNTTLFEKVSYMPKLQNTFGSGSSYDKFGDGVFDPIENQNWGVKLDGSLQGIGRVDENGNQQMVTMIDRNDEKKKFFNTGVTNQSDISLRDGDANSSYFTSFQNVSTSGIMPSDELYRRTFRLNADRKIGIIKLSSSINYINRKTNTTTSASNVYNDVINTPTEVPLTQYKDYINGPWADHNHFYNDYYPNPYEELARNRTVEKRDQLLASFSATANPTKWLQIIERPSYTLTNNTSKGTVGAIFYSPLAKANIYQAGTDKQASVTDASSLFTRFQNELIVTADKKFGDFSGRFIGENLIRYNYNKTMSETGNNLGIPTLFNISNYTGIPLVSGNTYASKLYSLTGSLELGYKNFAFVELTGRNDWDSRLPTNKNSYFYPGVSASLVLTDAIPDLKKLGNGNLLDYAKLRASYNRTGNVNTGGTNTNLGAYRLQSYYNLSTGFPYGTLPSYTADNTLLSPNLKPETVESYEVGLELTLLNNRINIDGAYFYQKNNDQVINVSLSQASGYSNVLLNAASFNNKGYELDLKTVPVRSGSVTWNVNFNYTHNTNEVKSLYGDVAQLGVTNSDGATSNAYVITGLPAYTLRLTDYLRDDKGRVIVDATTGLPTRNASTTAFGNTNPVDIFAVNTDVTYKHFSLHAVGEYRGGNFIYNDIGSSLGFTGNDYLSAVNGRQRFVFPNSVYSTDGGKTYTPNTNIVINNAHYDFLQAAAFRSTQTNYYTSAAFWKLREVSISYDVPQSWLKGTKIIKRANVSLVGRNLLMIRPKSNYWTDPEFSNTTENGNGTTTIGQLPPTRIYGFSVNVTF
jgi:TonB-linked SusC/RagA family outer membrane protein